MTAKWIDVADTAKLIRKVLRESFPGVKFSVRIDRYAGGSSTRVTWTDGPTAKVVEDLLSVFEAAGFDGMQDLKFYKDSTLDGERVNFGGGYLFTTRHYSDELVQRAIDAQIAAGHALPEAHYPQPTLDNWRAGRLLSSYPADVGDCAAWNELIYRDAARRMNARHLPRPSPTRERVGVAPAEGWTGSERSGAEVIPFDAPRRVQ